MASWRSSRFNTELSGVIGELNGINVELARLLVELNSFNAELVRLLVELNDITVKLNPPSSIKKIKKVLLFRFIQFKPFLLIFPLKLLQFKMSYYGEHIK